MNSRDPVTFRFGAYRLNPAARELFLDEERVALAPKVLDALLWLFEHRERAVGRAELGAAVWGKTGVSDSQLDQLVRNLRRAIGDTGSNQEVIRTVPRFGYRWVAEVGQLSIAEKPEAEHTRRPPMSGGDPPIAGPLAVRWRRSVLLALTVLCGLVVLAGGWLMFMRQPEPLAELAAVERPLVAAPLIAILPVEMESVDDSEWAWLRLGLMDLLAARLRDGGIVVVPSHNIVALMGAQEQTLPTAAKVREATGARIVIEPRMSRGDDGWRLKLELSGMEGSARELEIHAAEPATAAREAADRVLVMLGRPPVPGRQGGERPGEDALVQRMEAAIEGSRFDMARQLLDDAPESLRQLPRVRVREAEVLLGEGRSAQALIELQAVADAPAAASIDTETRVGALQGAGVVLSGERRFDESMRRFDAAIALAQASHLPMLYADAMQSRGAVRGMQGQNEAADSDFAQARIALEMIGDTLGLANLDATEAGAQIARGRYAEADALQSRAIERLERFPLGEFLQAAYGNKIYMDLVLLDGPGALATAARAQAMIDQTVPRQPLDPSLALHMVRARMKAGHIAEAGHTLNALLAGLDPAESPELYSNALFQQGELALDQGRAADAERLATQAEAMRALPELALPHYARGRASAALLRVRALQAQGRQVEAQAAVEQFAQWASASADSSVVVRLALARAEQSRQENHAEQAGVQFGEAMEAASRAAPVELAMVAGSYGRHLIAAGQLDQATRIIGRVARWAGQDFDCALLQVELYHALGQADAWRRALQSAQRLAGERAVPAVLAVSPTDGVDGKTSRTAIAPSALTRSSDPSNR